MALKEAPWAAPSRRAGRGWAIIARVTPSPTPPTGLLAADVGNSRVKLGWFPAAPRDAAAAGAAPEPAAVFAATPAELDDGRLGRWIESHAQAAALRLVVASVSRPAEERLLEAAAGWSVERLASQAAPIVLRVDEPSRIGVDRVVAAVAANRLRRPGAPAIVVDIGTAITIDLVAADGALEGGAILPGPTLAARALAEATDRLPDVLFGELDDAPDAVGRSTEPAIRAGLFWGAVGAIREIIDRQRDRLTTPPQVFLTGGAAPSVARLIGGHDLTVRCYPHLTLSGIAICAGWKER